MQFSRQRQCRLHSIKIVTKSVNQFGTETCGCKMHHIHVQYGMVKLSLCLIKHYAMKAYGAVDVYIHIYPQPVFMP
jgi:hypothetical protein